MIYIQLSLSINPCNETITDVISYQLGEISYESFVVNNNILEAYIRKTDFSEEKLKEVLQNLLIEARVDYEFKELEEKNWNKEWEKNYFQPLIVSNQCLVRSSFHNVTEKCKYEIIIDPKMAFGEVKLGEVDQIAGEKFDYIFANINRNILLQDIQHYADALNKDGVLIMSGFYLEDVPVIRMEFEKYQLSFQKFEQRDNWAAVVCSK